jgi:hypothetical protein
MALDNGDKGTGALARCSLWSGTPRPEIRRSTVAERPSSPKAPLNQRRSRAACGPVSSVS